MCRIRYEKGSGFKVQGSGFERQNQGAMQMTRLRLTASPRQAEDR
jgi:hypothetical protein